MLSSNELDKLMELMISQLDQKPRNSAEDTSANTQGNGSCKKEASTLCPQKVLVILGLIAGVLEVKSVLVDRDQFVGIFLDGSLKRKTRLDKMLDEIGCMPFDDVLRAILGRIT